MFTLFLPGIESAPEGASPRLPALERLLTRGRARPLATTPWALLARLAGGATDRWPVGPVSALGDGVGAPQACLRVEPLGSQQEQGGAFRLPAAQLAIAQDEAAALAGAFHDAFGTDGWRLVIAVPERWYLVAQDARASAAGWSGFAGPARLPGDGERPAPPEPGLRRLLSEVEMLFYAHPVNAARRARGTALIAGLHPWGGGRLGAGAPSSDGGAGVREEPFMAGLRQLGVLGASPRGRIAPGRIDPDGVAWPVPIETLQPADLEAVERDWAVPLLAHLQRGRVAGVRIVTGRRVHETRRGDALRFWRRPQPVGVSC